MQSFFLTDVTGKNKPYASYDSYAPVNVKVVFFSFLEMLESEGMGAYLQYLFFHCREVT